MTYQKTLEKIHGFQKFGSRLGLERMSKLMELLGNPQEKMKVIHVAGTNGKGSVCRYLYSVLQENGYRTGLYTSPFLEHFTERIEFDGKEISQEDLERCTETVLTQVDTMLESGMESPTEFELVTAIAFQYFSEKELDYLVLEVGLGGTGDSTNVVSKPLASVITSISYDHMDYLGDTLTKIAREKAGIIKSGVPIIYRVSNPEASDTICKIAHDRGAKRYDIGNIGFVEKEISIDGYTFDTTIDGIEYHNLKIAMLGRHQIENAICAVAVLQVLEQDHKIELSHDGLYRGLLKAKQKGRFEIVSKTPYIILDGAHNEAGANALKTVFLDHFAGKKTLMVTGMLADKKTDEMILEFGKIANDFVATEPDNPRKMPANELAEKLKKAGLKCIAMKDSQDAYDYARSKSEYEVIVIAGSLYLIGTMRGLIYHA